MTNLAQQYQLREYQEELIQKINAEWEAGNRRVLAQSPTGSGKTVIGSAIAHQFTYQGEGVLVVAHRQELLFQFKDKLETITGESVGIIKAGHKLSPNALIQVASVQTLAQREYRPSAELVILDECHHTPAKTYVDILDCYPNAFILGLSATPCRNDGRGFRNHYDVLVSGWSVRRLIDAGYLSKFRLFAATKQIKIAGIDIVKGDYDQSQLAQAVNASLTMGDVVKTRKKHAADKLTIVFCVNIKHSKEVAKAYRQAGYAAEHIDGEMHDKERAAIMQRFKSGETLILTNCGIFSEGVDVPDIGAVQILRPTRSLQLHLQQLGRGLRPSEGKEYLIILDHTENYLYHGLIDDGWEWTLDAVSLKNRQHAVECPDCNHCFVPTATEQNKLEAFCPNCGIMIQLEAPVEGFGGDKPEVTNDKGVELEEIITEVNSEIMLEIMKLKAIQMTKKYKPFWVYHQIVDAYPNIGLGELRELAKMLKHRPGWAWYKWCELQEKLKGNMKCG